MEDFPFSFGELTPAVEVAPEEPELWVESETMLFELLSLFLSHVKHIDFLFELAAVVEYV